MRKGKRFISLFYAAEQSFPALVGGSRGKDSGLYPRVGLENLFDALPVRAVLAIFANE